MTSDFEELLSIFNETGVKYLIVGGHAVMLYTEPRFTKHLDIWVEATEENSPKVFRALAKFGAPLTGIAPGDFSTPRFFYQIGVPPVRVDILTAIDGVEFAQAWPNRVVSRLGNIETAFIGKQDLIQNKRTSARHIDLHDAEQLE